MNISQFQRCANCGACYNICPHQAIRVEKEHTYYAPVVDTEKCVDCGLCSAVCPVNHEVPALEPIKAFAGWHKEHDVVHASSSGGMFYGLAKRVLDQGGAVFGAKYSEDLMQVEFASTDDTELSALQKSKYVESLPGNVFERIRSELSKGRKVLFCGTPCQVAGLKAYLRQDHEQLITCDFACGGLPSHKMYQEHLQALEKKYGAQAESVDFRPKTHGWRRYALLVKFKNGKCYNRLGVEDAYLKSFLYSRCTVRRECLNCKFSDHHQSDLTIADFWRNAEFSDLHNDHGISLVLCNTDKGAEMMEKIRGDYVLEELSAADVCYNNRKTSASEKEREKHDAFVRLYEQEGWTKACKEYFSSSWMSSMKNMLRRMVCRARS